MSSTPISTTPPPSTPPSTPSSFSFPITCCDMCSNTKSQTVQLYVCSFDRINKDARFIVCSNCLFKEVLFDITDHFEVI